jgi:hypothetical protein
LKNILANDIALDKYFLKSLPLLSKYKDKLPPSIALIMTLYLKEVDTLENAHKYQPGADGFKECLEDFNERLLARGGV